MKGLRKKLYELPKADLHHHLHLGGDIQKLKSIYGRPDFSVPLTYAGLPGMIDFIELQLNTLIRTADDAIHLMVTALENSMADNVRYLEASVDLRLARYFGGSLEELIAVVDELKNKYSSQLEFCPDIGLNKSISIDEALSAVEKCIASGVFSGIDIYGQEDNTDLAAYVDIYDLAREARLKTKVHIGEFSTPDTIDSAMELLRPDVLQHGIRAIDSKMTMGKITEKGIQLNICPQSNVALGAITSLMDHPVRTFFDRGIHVTINTDDYLLFGASITDQYQALIESGLFTFGEIEAINKNTLNSVGGIY